MDSIGTIVLITVFKSYSLATNNHNFKDGMLMLNNTDYLVNLDKKIVKKINNPDTKIIQLVKHFTNYVNYMSEKIKMKSPEEIKICTSLWTKMPTGPSFFQMPIDFDEMRSLSSWDAGYVREFRDALVAAEKAWVGFAVVSRYRNLWED